MPQREKIRLRLIKEHRPIKWLGSIEFMGIVVPFLLLVAWIGGLLLVLLSFLFKLATLEHLCSMLISVPSV